MDSCHSPGFRLNVKQIIYRGKNREIKRTFGPRVDELDLFLLADGCISNVPYNGCNKIFYINFSLHSLVDTHPLLLLLRCHVALRHDELYKCSRHKPPSHELNVGSISTYSGNVFPFPSIYCT